MDAAVVCCLLALEMASGLQELPGAPLCSGVFLPAVLHARHFSWSGWTMGDPSSFPEPCYSNFHATLCIYSVSTLVLFERPKGCVLRSWALSVMSRTPFLISRA